MVQLLLVYEYPECMQHSFCNYCMFVPENGWKSGHIHGILAIFMEFWLLSWNPHYIHGFWLLSWNSAIFMEFWLLSWNSGYFHGTVAYFHGILAIFMDSGYFHGILAIFMEFWLFSWNLVFCQWLKGWNSGTLAIFRERVEIWLPGNYWLDLGKYLCTIGLQSRQ